MIMATFKMNPQHYNIFLSHHKAAAATFVRFCKMLLVKNAGMIAYIDSDDLVDLADLYDVVGFRTHNLVVFLTGQTLTRARCAGATRRSSRSARSGSSASAAWRASRPW